MRLLEYEAKKILEHVGVPVPRSEIIIPGSKPSFLPTVLKSQVPTGGRGKAGGIQIVTKENELIAAINQVFSLPIKGFLPNKLLAEELIAMQHEYYLSLLIDKTAATVQIMAHKNGGVEVEQNDAKSFMVLSVDAKNSEAVGEQLAEYFNLPDQSFALQDLVKNLYTCFTENDATLIEINPLIYTSENLLVAGDCKMELDTAAAFRHPEWNFEDKPRSSNFITLNEDGTVATIANGAGLAMATVDAVTDFGLKPANFLDIGGGANSESILKAFRKITEYRSVAAIVINIFAGITRCDEVAKAIIDAKEQIADLPPLYIRLAGTNVEAAKELLADQQISLLPDLEACLVAIKKETGSV